ncbi:M48 family metallopeptidase [Sneathiella limimaris]|uniref:M48 family metallopeptidase n=1 Tax=Sneathiella limimaris TaxID=1964213 RepID=UPI00146CF1F4|nr:M48 family metallopeptidase [Sneathiella limimaris]
MFFRVLGVILCLSLAACNTTSVEGPVSPGYKPALTSTEAGLWMTMNKFERRLANSALVERDPELNAYVKSVICRVSEAHCQDIQLFILKNPYFNASMAPNGSMFVWTGLLLRVQNEDQLAAVLGHELVHYVNRHSLQQWNRTKATLEFLTFFTIATGGFDFGITGMLATVGAMGALQGYSRDHEHEADAGGVKLVHEAGYDVDEIVKLWELIEAEHKASEKETPSIFWATHPANEDRIKRLTEEGERLKADRRVLKRGPSSKFQDVYAKHWHQWAQNLVTVSGPKEASVVLEHLEANGQNAEEIAYFIAEVYRRKGTEDELEKAKEYYLKAASIEPAPLKTHKHLGLVEKRLGRNEAAISSFETYLEQNPSAADAKLVRSYIEQLRK